MDHCFLCGTSLTTRRRRYQLASQLKHMLQHKCTPTPFVQSLLLSTECSDDKEPLCVPCVNWKRRCWNGSLKRKAKPVLQIDQLIMFLLSPGSMQEPDQRCVQRLVLALKQPGNPLRKALPMQVETILGNMEGEDVHSAISAWWDYNGKCEFFANGDAARFVRSSIKACEEA